MREADGRREGRLLVNVRGFDGELEMSWSPEDQDQDEDKGRASELQIGTFPAGSDAFDIDDASISGDELNVDVRYGGGCEDHEFELFWDGRILETNPPRARLRLFHDANGDICEAIKRETLVFDVSAFGGGPLRVRLSGFDGELDLE
jgi:hypothetical protein